VSKVNWKKYGLEFLSIFIAVISAFALNNWNDNRHDSNAESKILNEIHIGLNADLEDITVNRKGHHEGIKVADYFIDIVSLKEFSKDSFVSKYFGLTRDFISVQNTGGYETLKSSGLELIENDSLRSRIVSLYEYDYNTLRKMEEEYLPAQFHLNYFQKINDVLSPNLIYNKDGTPVDMKPLNNLSVEERNKVHSLIWRIKINRRLIGSFYDELEVKIKDLIEEIEAEI